MKEVIQAYSLWMKSLNVKKKYEICIDNRKQNKMRPHNLNESAILNVGDGYRGGWAGTATDDQYLDEIMDTSKTMHYLANELGFRRI